MFLRLRFVFIDVWARERERERIRKIQFTVEEMTFVETLQVIVYGSEGKRVRKSKIVRGLALVN